VFFRYVQKNFALARRKKSTTEYRHDEEADRTERFFNRKANPEIIEHNRKREVELKLVEMQDLMEEQGYADDEIEDKIDKERTRLLAALTKTSFNNKSKDTHSAAQERDAKNDRMGAAFGINKDYEAGNSFNQEIQEQKKVARIEEREREKIEREREYQERQKTRDSDQKEDKRDDRGRDNRSRDSDRRRDYDDRRPRGNIRDRLGDSRNSSRRSRSRSRSRDGRSRSRSRSRSSSSGSSSSDSDKSASSNNKRHKIKRPRSPKRRSHSPKRRSRSPERKSRRSRSPERKSRRSRSSSSSSGSSDSGSNSD